MSLTESGKGIPVTLGAGFMRGVSHTGALHFLEESGVKVEYFLGSSIGALVAAAVSNGIPATEIKSLFVDDLHQSVISSALKDMLPSILEPVRRLGGVQAVSRSLVPPFWDPTRLLGGGFIDMLPTMRSMVRRLDLKPNDRLGIASYDILKRKIVVYKGRHYDLAEALAASCAIPFLFRPPRWNRFDSGVLHPHPVIGESPSIVFKLIDFPFLKFLFQERSRDFAVSVGDQSQSFIGVLDEVEADQLFDRGYNAAQEALSEPIEKALIPTN